MYSKNIIIFIALVFSIQVISSQCVGSIESVGYTASWGPAPSTEALCAWISYTNPTAEAATLAASNGPGLAISSASYVIPTGMTVISENAYEGVLSTGGAVPFLGTVAFEGGLHTAGLGAISYECGNEAIGIVAEDIGSYGFTSLAYGAGFPAPLVYGSGIGYGPNGYAKLW